MSGILFFIFANCEGLTFLFLVGWGREGLAHKNILIVQKGDHKDTAEIIHDPLLQRKW